LRIAFSVVRLWRVVHLVLGEREIGGIDFPVCVSAAASFVMNRWTK